MRPTDIPVLTTERLLLRPFTQDDLDELVPIHQEESFWWYPMRRGMTADETAAFLTRVIAHYETDGFGLEAVIDRSSEVMLGWAGLAVPHFLPQILPAVEVGWRLVPAARGRGLATEAGAAALRYGFTDGGLERIVSIYEPENVASGKVMEHLGLRQYLSTPGPRGEELYVTELGRADWDERAPAVGDAAIETAVERIGDGRYRAMVHSDWEIWGPCGGYVAAIALRAAQAESPFARPASFYCHYLSVAAFAPVELEVTPLRAGRTVLAQRVVMTQEGRSILEAMVWSVGEVAGLEHQDLDPPLVSDPLDTPTWDEIRRGQEERPRMAFWENFEQRPIDGLATWPPPGPLPPTWRAWVRYNEHSGAREDAWVLAARLLIVLDVGSWPAGSRPHAYEEPPFIAPSLDLHCSFTDPLGASEWLLLDSHSPVAQDGLLAWTGRVWSTERGLLVTGGGQTVFRHT